MPLANNCCEQLIRPVEVGQRDWLFAGSLSGGERMVDLLTLLHTARRTLMSLRRGWERC
ncbi:IS66 family transposase [Pantoea endophytica]